MHHTPLLHPPPPPHQGLRTDTMASLGPFRPENEVVPVPPEDQKLRQMHDRFPVLKETEDSRSPLAHIGSSGSGCFHYVIPNHSSAPVTSSSAVLELLLLIFSLIWMEMGMVANSILTNIQKRKRRQGAGNALSPVSQGITTQF